MTEKWVEYALAGIKYYIIIDSHDVSSDGRSHVIVGHLDLMTNPNVRRSLDAFPTFEDRKPTRLETFYVLAKQYERKLYYKTIFTDNDVVSTPFLKDLKLTATEMQSPTYLKSRLKNVWLQQKLSPSESQDCEDSQRHIKKMMERQHEQKLSELRREKSDALAQRDTERKAREKVERERDAERVEKDKYKALYAELLRKNKMQGHHDREKLSIRKSDQGRSVKELGENSSTFHRNSPQGDSNSHIDERRTSLLTERDQFRSQPLLSLNKRPNVTHAQDTDRNFGKNSSGRRFSEDKSRHGNQSNSGAQVTGRKRRAPERATERGAQPSPSNSPQQQKSRIVKMISNWFRK